MGDFKNLVAWQEANALANDMHAANPLRNRRDYPGLRAQLLKAAGSVADCLAEGCGKRSRLELARFSGMAYTSAQEVQSQLMRARACGVLTTVQCDDFDRRADRVASSASGCPTSEADPEDDPASNRFSDVRQFPATVTGTEVHASSCRHASSP